VDRTDTGNDTNDVVSTPLLAILTAPRLSALPRRPSAPAASSPSRKYSDHPECAVPRRPSPAPPSTTAPTSDAGPAGSAALARAPPRTDTARRPGAGSRCSCMAGWRAWAGGGGRRGAAGVQESAVGVNVVPDGEVGVLWVLGARLRVVVGVRL